MTQLDTPTTVSVGASRVMRVAHLADTPGRALCGARITATVAASDAGRCNVCADLANTRDWTSR